MSDASLPKAPDSEKGKQVREQYFALAKSSARGVKSYEDLYERYARSPNAAQALDQEVARTALKSGSSPRQVIQLLAQGPFTQQQTISLEPEEKKAAIPGLLQYAQTVVNSVQQQRYLEYACAVTGTIQSYPDLYREYVGSDLSAIQLDQKVTAAALGAGENANAVSQLLQQGPYARFQLDVKHVPLQTIEQYASGTVAQVQAIQSLHLGQSQRLPNLSKGLEL
jgi:hypothetical protein